MQPANAGFKMSSGSFPSPDSLELLSSYIGNASSFILHPKAEPADYRSRCSNPPTIFSDLRIEPHLSPAQLNDDFNGWSNIGFCSELDDLNCELDFEPDFLDEALLLEDSSCWVTPQQQPNTKPLSSSPRFSVCNTRYDRVQSPLYYDSDDIQGSRCSSSIDESVAAASIKDTSQQQIKQSSLSDGGWTDFLMKVILYNICRATS
jgi:hypothetical protein